MIVKVLMIMRSNIRSRGGNAMEDSLVMDMDMEAMVFTSTSSRKKEWFTHGATTRYHSLADLPKKATSKMK